MLALVGASLFLLSLASAAASPAHGAMAVADAISATADTTIERATISLDRLMAIRYQASGETDLTPEQWEYVLTSDAFLPSSALLPITMQEEGRLYVESKLESKAAFLGRCRQLQARADLLDRTVWPKPYVVDFILPAKEDDLPILGGRATHALAHFEGARFSEDGRIIPGAGACIQDPLSLPEESGFKHGTCFLEFYLYPNREARGEWRGEWQVITSFLDANDIELTVLSDFLQGNGTMRVRLQIDNGLEDPERQREVYKRLKQIEKSKEGPVVKMGVEHPPKKLSFGAVVRPRVTLVGTVVRSDRGDSVVSVPAAGPGAVAKASKWARDRAREPRPLAPSERQR
ncbi:MAG TPA: hypothetical protein VGK89_06985 [Candidatus Eisenbacteria bacterium]